MSGRHLHLQSEDLGSALSSPQASAGRKGRWECSGVPLFKVSLLKDAARRSTFSPSTRVNPLGKSPLVCSGDKTPARER